MPHLNKTSKTEFVYIVKSTKKVCGPLRQNFGALKKSYAFLITISLPQTVFQIELLEYILGVSFAGNSLLKIDLIFASSLQKYFY